MTRTAAQLSAEINGANHGNVTAGINGNLPPGWVAYGLHAMPVPASPAPTEVAITCGTLDLSVAAWSSPQLTRGAKVVVPADADLLNVADKLAEQLRERIADHQREQMRSRSLIVRIALLPGATLPARKTAGASGYDLCALVQTRVEPGRVATIDTGVTLELPSGTEAQVRPRSGLATRGIWGNFGSIDADYRGTIRVILVNLGSDAVTFAAGDRIAQLVFARVSLPEFVVVDAGELTETGRGASGLGSTGTR